MSAVAALFVMRDASLGVTNAFKSTFLRFCWSFCTVFVLLWVAIMMYITFYYAYMPTVRHVYPVHLQFRTDCQKSPRAELCSFPEANVTFTTGERMLMRGQRYQVFLDLDMPQSEVNEKLGMFMVQVKFTSSSGAVLSHSSRSCMLHYKSGLLQSLSTLFFSLPMLTGFLEEKQTVPVQLHENYIEDSYRPAVAINIVILTKKIELYSASLRIEALFTGLRFIMFTWPGTSALFGVTCNFIAISVIFFFAYSAFTPEPFYEEPETVESAEDIANVGDEPQRHRAARRQHSSEGSVRQSDAPESLAVVSNGRFEPVGSKHRSYKVKKIPQSASLPPHDYECSDGLLRSATFPPYRWECEGEGEVPGTRTKAPALWGTSLHQAQCSANRSSSLSSGTSCVGGIAKHEPATCSAGANGRAVGATKLHTGEAHLEQASTNHHRVTPVMTCHDIEHHTCSHTITAHSGHATVDSRNAFYEEDGGVVFDTRLESLPGRCVRKVADGECSCQYRPCYDEASTYSPRLSHSSLSSEDCAPIEPSCTHTKGPLCSAYGACHIDGVERATVICNCGATQINARARHFKGRVPDGAPAHGDSSIQPVIPRKTSSVEREPVQNSTLNYGYIKGPYNDGPFSGDPCGESKMSSGQVKYEDPSQEPQLKRRSAAKSRAGFRLSLKKIISRK